MKYLAKYTDKIIIALSSLVVNDNKPGWHLTEFGFKYDFNNTVLGMNIDCKYLVF